MGIMILSLTLLKQKDKKSVMYLQCLWNAWRKALIYPHSQFKNFQKSLRKRCQILTLIAMEII